MPPPNPAAGAGGAQKCPTDSPPPPIQPFQRLVALYSAPEDAPAFGRAALPPLTLQNLVALHSPLAPQNLVALHSPMALQNLVALHPPPVDVPEFGQVP